MCVKRPFRLRRPEYQPPGEQSGRVSAAQNGVNRFDYNFWLGL